MSEHAEIIKVSYDGSHDLTQSFTSKLENSDLVLLSQASYSEIISEAHSTASRGT